MAITCCVALLLFWFCLFGFGFFFLPVPPPFPLPMGRGWKAIRVLLHIFTNCNKAALITVSSVLTLEMCKAQVPLCKMSSSWLSGIISIVLPTIYGKFQIAKYIAFSLCFECVDMIVQIQWPEVINLLKWFSSNVLILKVLLTDKKCAIPYFIIRSPLGYISNSCVI